MRYLRKQNVKHSYNEIISEDIPKNIKPLQKCFGLLWTKQFYYYNVHKWVFGKTRNCIKQKKGTRNFSWQHLNNRHVTYDKWEYLGTSAWDLASPYGIPCRNRPFFANNNSISFTRKLYASQWSNSSLH
jgi:hypothetical protein